MNQGQVSAETRRTCVGIAVIGSLMVIAGIMLGLTAQVVATGLPEVGLVAWGLIAGGMLCGIILIVASGPGSGGSGGGRRRRSAPSEEWIRGLRPPDSDHP